MPPSRIIIILILKSGYFILQMKKTLCKTILGALFGTAVLAGDKEAWKSRTIYQVLTDRFARSNGDSSSCNNLSDYCGGTW
jgi:hypothetical protein